MKAVRRLSAGCLTTLLKIPSTLQVISVERSTGRDIVV
jgi:hypothetical protein